MAEETVFSSLFPEGVVEHSYKILCLKNKLDQSIPALLIKNGFSKMYNETNVYSSSSKRMILFYEKREPKSRKKRKEISSKCIELKNTHPNDTLIIGYLIGTDTVNETEIILHNMVLKVMVGETFLRHILPFDAILEEYRAEVNEFFS